MRAKTKEEILPGPITFMPVENGPPVQLPALYQVADRAVDMMERAIVGPKFDVKKMSAVLDMQERILDRQSKMAFNIALNACQGEIEPVAVNAYNTQTKSKYAKLEAVDKAIRPIYRKHGFSVSFDGSPLTEDNKITVKCFVAHNDGFTREYTLQGKLDIAGFKGTANKTEIQGLGTTVSYLRRYLLLMIFNVIIEDEDVDGNADKSAKPPVDEMAARVASEAKASPAPEDDAWDGKVAYGTDRYPIPDMGQAVEKIKELMGKHTTKATRIKIINQNLSLIRALVKNNLGNVVTDLHALADKGEANGAKA